MPHSRTDTGQDDLCLRYLSGCEFKAYRYLVNRADTIGVSYPKIETIAAGIGYGVREVQRALDALNENDVFRYRRKNAFDRETRRKISNVYQVNPDILVVAQEFEAEARSEWDALINQCGNVSTGLWSHINQHQEPTPRTNVSNQFQNQHHQDNRTLTETGQKPKAKNGIGATGHNDLTHQPAGQGVKSSVPPARPKFSNPNPVNQELPNEHHEQLATSIRDLGINLALARGFIAEYGFDRSKSAFAETVLMGEEARKPAAVFRAIIQTRLADEVAVARQAFFKTRREG